MLLDDFVQRAGARIPLSQPCCKREAGYCKMNRVLQVVCLHTVGPPAAIGLTGEAMEKLAPGKIRRDRGLTYAQQELAQRSSVIQASEAVF